MTLPGLPDLKVRTACSRSETREPPDEIWRELDGSVIASGWLRGGRREIAFPGLAIYEFSADQGSVIATPEPGAATPAIFDTYFRSVLPLVLQVRGAEVLHASGLIIGGGLVPLCAVSGTGKSTLARALSRRGHRLWADDAVVLDGTNALPLPFRVKLRTASQEWFSEPALSPVYRGLPACPLRAICVLERDESSPVRIHRLTQAAAFPQLLRHAYCFSLADRERRRTMLERYLRLAIGVPVFELRFRSGLSRLEEMADEIKRAVALPDYSSRWTVAGENPGMHTATYSAPSACGVL